MTRLVSKLLAAVAVCSCCVGIAFADDYAVDAYGYHPDDVAVNQAVVAYWYAHGYSAAYGNVPKDFAELTAKGLPYRNFTSPHTGDAINPDDGSLDFDGDFTYSSAGGDATFTVKTSKGDVTVPGSYEATGSDINAQFNSCYSCVKCPTCFDPTICACESWGCFCSDATAGARIIGDMMWDAFEAHEKLFGARPTSEKAFFASGLSPVGANYAEFNKNLTIEWFYRDVNESCDTNCCRYLVKAFVKGCPYPCGCCCEKPECCPKEKCGSSCGCKDKCGSCNKCESKCGCKSKCNTCNKCENKCGCKSKCNKCENKCGCKDKCGCKSKCGCGKCGR